MLEIPILLVKTVLLRPYVFFFLGLALFASIVQLGWWRTLILFPLAYAIALLSELSSTHNGFPYGHYVYLEQTRGQELWIGNVPFMDSLSYSFLAYSSYALALFLRSPLWRSKGNLQLVDSHRIRSSPAVLVLAVTFFVLIDVVIDPVALRGERWFLGQIFYYPQGGIYFGVPLSNFGGWLLVGAAILAAYQGIDRYLARHRHLDQEWGIRAIPYKALFGPLLYGLVLAFNVAVTFAIGEYLLGLVALFIALPLTVVIVTLLNKPSNRATAEELARHGYDFPHSPLACRQERVNRLRTDST